MTEEALCAIERLYDQWCARSGSVNWGDLIVVVPALISEVRRLREVASRLDAEKGGGK